MLINYRRQSSKKRRRRRRRRRRSWAGSAECFRQYGGRICTSSMSNHLRCSSQLRLQIPSSMIPGFQAGAFINRRGNVIYYYISVKFFIYTIILASINVLQQSLASDTSGEWGATISVGMYMISHSHHSSLVDANKCRCVAHFKPTETSRQL